MERGSRCLYKGHWTSGTTACQPPSLLARRTCVGAPSATPPRVSRSRNSGPDRGNRSPADPVRALVLVLALLLAWPQAVDAADADRLCLACHNAARSPQVHEIFLTAHGVASDARTPEGSGGCSACHGDAGAHLANPMGAPPAVSFGPRWPSTPPAQTGACLNCHAAAAAHWDGGAHALEDMTCSACHRAHSRAAPVLKRTEQAGVCYGCHRDVRAAARLPSRHPIQEAVTVCSDCHDPHGSLEPADLSGTSLTETCLGCHAQMRGPFLFDHPPAAEDCSICHRPHGSVHEPLLEARGPQLCQSCHQAAFHPSDLAGGGGLASGRPNSSLLGRNCLNCHPSIHGSNHLTR